MPTRTIKNYDTHQNQFEVDWVNDEIYREQNK